MLTDPQKDVTKQTLIHPQDTLWSQHTLSKPPGCDEGCKGTESPSGSDKGSSGTGGHPQGGAGGFLADALFSPTEARP